MSITRARGKDLLYQLDKAKDEGWINRQYHSNLPLVIYQYSPMTMYSQRWTGITELARGLVLHKETGDIVTKSFSKFYNWSEQAAPKPPKDKPYVFYAKVDGSLLNAVKYEGEWLLTTKGSFS